MIRNHRSDIFIEQILREVRSSDMRTFMRQRGAGIFLILRSRALRREEALRGNVARLVDDLHEHGRSFLEISDLLRLSPRTLRSWCADFRDMPEDAPRCVPLGRPAIRSPRDERSAVLAVLDELGPATGLPTLRECFPFMPRAELEDLLRRYRRVWQRRYHYAPRILRWQTPGAVWAMDYSQAPEPIDGTEADVTIPN